MTTGDKIRLYKPLYKKSSVGWVTNGITNELEEDTQYTITKIDDNWFRINGVTLDVNETTYPWFLPWDIYFVWFGFNFNWASTIMWLPWADSCDRTAGENSV